MCLATAVKVAYLAAQTGRSTVLWDLDPQGAATYSLKGSPDDRVSAKKLARGKRATERLKMMTRSLHDGFDLLVLDRPPGMTMLTENVLRAADVLLVPIVPATLSLRMLDQLGGFIAHTGWTDIRILPFFSMVDRRKSLHESLITNARTRHLQFLVTEIPHWSDIERITVRRAPLPAFAPASPAARLYARLWEEIAACIGEPVRAR